MQKNTEHPSSRSRLTSTGKFWITVVLLDLLFLAFLALAVCPVWAESAPNEFQDTTEILVDLWGNG